MRERLGHFFNALLDVSVSDPDDARRRKLLNLVLIGIGGFAGLAFLSLLGLFILRGTEFVAQTAWLGVVGALVGVAVFTWSNRSRAVPGWATSGLFLVFLLALLMVIDSPAELAAGRSVFMFVVPIIMASILLYPAASFALAGLASLELWYLASQARLFPNPFVVGGFFLIALVSWLAARNLEKALYEVRVINKELDRRVADRTRELSEALTRESEQASQRQAILQGIADGVIVLDTQGQVILTNPALIRLLELPLDKVLHKSLAEIIQVPQVDEEDRKMILRSIGFTETTLAPIRVKWGVRTLSMIAAPVRDLHGHAIGSVAVLRDFTREAEIEQMKNAFVAMVSHELRTPLNAILGYSEMLHDGFYGAVSEKQANITERILDNSRRLLHIVSDLLDQARIEAGKLKFDYQIFYTRELIENLHSLMDGMARDKGLTLTLRVDDNMPTQLTGDVLRVQQILLNLVANAIKFTDEGGVEVYIYKINEQYWGFDVTDTGQGMAPDVQKSIFEPFHQLEGAVTRSHRGIGLGLSIVKRLVELMGGQIFLKSIAGQGSVFTIVLRFKPPQTEEKRGNV